MPSAATRLRLPEDLVRTYTIIIERCSETGLYVGYIPGFAGAHSQGETVEELRENMQEVVAMLLEDGEPEFESQFVGTETVQVD
jgi:predicted RNase H-like HicB family nuclease